MRLMLALACLALVVCACAADKPSAGHEQFLEITTLSLPTGTVGIPYSATFEAKGGSTPYTWNLSGTLPAGLVFDTPTATISGTPQTTVSATVTIAVTDLNASTVSHRLLLDIVPVPPLTLSAPTTSASPGVAMAFSLQASGGVSPYTFAITSGSLPPGITLDASTGQISGTPSTLGDWTATAEVTDLASSTASAELTLVVAPPLTVIGSPTLPDAFETHAWYARLDATGGVAPYQWSAASLPGWMTLTTSGDGYAELTGTPTGTGTLAFTLDVADQRGATGQIACTLDVLAPPSGVTTNPVVVTTQMPHAVVGEYYELELAGAGGLASYKWKVNPALPTGMYLDAWPGTTNILRGRPVQAGVYDLVIAMDDNFNMLATRSLSLVVEPSISALPAATVGTEYAHQASFDDGGASLSATVDSAPWLNGVALSSTGALTGSPVVDGRAAVSVKFSDGTHDIYKLMGMDVRPHATALSIFTTQLPPATRGSGYSYSALLQAEGGSGQGYYWTLLSGSLPPGLTGLPARGPAAAEITGAATQIGSYNFSVQVTDSVGATASSSFTIVVKPPVQGDFDGDGQADVLIGTATSVGIVTPGGGTVTPTGVHLFYGESAHRSFGGIGHDTAGVRVSAYTSACSFGDFNGDGIADLMFNQHLAAGVLSPSIDYRVCIQYGSAQRFYGTIAANSVDCRISGPSDTSFGKFSAAGDIDGDGTDDLIVTAPKRTTSAGVNAGAVYVFYGGAGVFQGAFGAAYADAVWEGMIAGGGQYTLPGYLGDSLLVKDLNNDGYMDIVVGARANTYVVYGRPTRFAGTTAIGSVADAVVTGGRGSIRGDRLVAADFNGDGITDLVTGGKVSYGFHGMSGAYPLIGNYDASGADLIIDMGPGYTSNKVSIAGGDFDGDGDMDLAFGASETATVNIFWGGSSLGGGAALDWSQSPTTLTFGAFDDTAWALRAFDHDGDGKDDLLVGAPGITNVLASLSGIPVHLGAGLLFYGDTDIPQTGSVAGPTTAGARFMATDGVIGFGACANGG